MNNQRPNTAEKLILLMLCDLYDRLGVKGQVDADFVREEILSGGHYWALDRKFGPVFTDTFVSEEIAHETAQILSMWDTLEHIYEDLSEEGRKQIEEEWGEPPLFRGFYANEEIEHLSVADCMINRLDLFSRFKGRELDSHMPGGLAAYGRMLKAFNQAMEQFSRDLTASQVIAILRERVHPDNR